MRIPSFASFWLFVGSLPPGILAQSADPNVASEVFAVRAELARSMMALRQYTWTEHTDVLVKGDVKSSTTLLCRYDRSGNVIKTPVNVAKDGDPGSLTSNRPLVRKKADMQDYIERAVSRIHAYVPPNPEQIDHLVRTGQATLGQSPSGQKEVRFTNYFEDKDSLVFTYDPASKVLLRVNVASTLGSPKDPVTLEAVFETLLDGVNHLSSATLNAKSRKIQVKARNVMYQKLAP